MGTGTNKSDLGRMLSTKVELPLRKAEEIVDKFFETMSKELLSGGRTEIRGFGSFEVREYEGSMGRNLRTAEETVVLPKKLPFFKVGKDFKERVDQK